MANVRGLRDLNVVVDRWGDLIQRFCKALLKLHSSSCLLENVCLMCV